MSVLIFHRVLDHPDPMRPTEPCVRQFESTVRFVSRNFHVLPLYDAVARQKCAGASGHALAITFDDGYADNLNLAMPILRKYNAPATFFVSSGFLDGGTMWNDRIIEGIRLRQGPELDATELGLGRYRTEDFTSRRAAANEIIRALKYRAPAEREDIAAQIHARSSSALPRDLMLTTNELRDLANEDLAEIGGHTVSHPILTSVRPDDALREIIDGKQALESRIGHKLRCFAYPNGIPGVDYAAEHVKMVARAGFELAVSTSRGAVRDDSDRFQLPRFTPWDRQKLKFGLRLLAMARSRGTTAV